VPGDDVARDDIETALPAGADAAQLQRLLDMRAQLLRERDLAATPAVSRALEMADYYLFLGLSYFGYSERLFPEQD
jgi:hypothetical protein